MRWFRRGQADREIALDPARQDALLAGIRQRFGPNRQVSFRDQATAVASDLVGDDGLMAAMRLMSEAAEESYAGVQAQVSGRYPVDRRNYRAVWRALGPSLRTPLFHLPSGFHPHIHVAAAVAVTGRHAPRCVQLTDPAWALRYPVELLDLTTAGWEFGRIPVDPDAARLVHALIGTIAQLRNALDDPPPLPSGVRELMRRNNTTPVVDGAGQVVGGINVGAEARPAFLT